MRKTLFIQTILVFLFFYVVPIAIQAFVQTLHRPEDPLVIAVGLQAI
jgi:hypothetical protein